MFLQHLCIWSSILKRGIIQFSFCKSNFKKLSWFLYQWKLSYLPSWFYFVLKLLPSWRKVEGKLFIPRRLIYQCCSKTQSTFVIYKKNKPKIKTPFTKYPQHQMVSNDILLPFGIMLQMSDLVPCISYASKPQYVTSVVYLHSLIAIMMSPCFGVRKVY